jgi:hypothetical protein
MDAAVVRNSMTYQSCPVANLIVVDEPVELKASARHPYNS